jgi:hypothetical protein
LEAIRETFSGDNFQNGPLKKAFIIFALVVACFVYGTLAISIATTLLPCYFVYYIIWTSINKRHPRQAATSDNAGLKARVVVHSDENQRTAAWSAADEVAKTPNPRGVRSPLRRVRSTWRDRANQQLAAKPLREKLSELLGSMLMAAVFAALTACVARLLRPARFRTNRILCMVGRRRHVGQLGRARPLETCRGES